VLILLVFRPERGASGPLCFGYLVEMLVSALLGPKCHDLLELGVWLIRILKENVAKCAGEPAAVSEALGAITALAVSGDASLVNAVSHERAGP
jgi:hypothetical protein